MQKSELRERFERLRVFAGEWEGEERMAPSPWSAGGTAHGQHRFGLVAGGTALAQSERQQRDGALSLSGHGSGEVLWFWFDDFGHPPLDPARGDWAGSTLRLARRTPRGETRSSFTPEADGWRQLVEVRPSGQADFSDFLSARS